MRPKNQKALDLFSLRRALLSIKLEYYIYIYNTFTWNLAKIWNLGLFWIKELEAEAQVLIEQSQILDLIFVWGLLSSVY